MTRLPGPGGSEAVRARVAQLEAEAAYRRMVAGFQLQRAADQAARTGALLDELIHVLAQALDAEGEHTGRARRTWSNWSERCRRCTCTLPTRARTCPRCGFRTGHGTGPPAAAA